MILEHKNKFKKRTPTATALKKWGFMSLSLSEPKYAGGPSAPRFQAA